jgi:hypothetical protein
MVKGIERQFFCRDVISIANIAITLRQEHCAYTVESVWRIVL